MDTNGYIHDAFISYSRTNIRWAKRIEDYLEKISLPKELGIKRNKLKIFRDISDFASNELGEGIRDEIRSSKFLIVICSPAKKKSKYVTLEIREFLKLNVKDKVVLFLVDGSADPKVILKYPDKDPFNTAIVETYFEPRPLDLISNNKIKEIINPTWKEQLDIVRFPNNISAYFKDADIDSAANDQKFRSFAFNVTEGDELDGGGNECLDSDRNYCTPIVFPI